MLVVEVMGRFSTKNEEFFIDQQGKRTRYLSKAASFPNDEMARVAGEQFVQSGKGYSFTVNQA